MSVQPIRVTSDIVPARRFDAAFCIGRAEECELRIQNEYVSRRQAMVEPRDGQWWVRDLGSSNGIYIGGERVAEAPIYGALSIRLGIEGPELHLEVEQAAPAPLESTAQYVARYFDKAKPDEAIGEHTRMVRRAFQKVEKKKTRKYRAIVAGLVVVIAVVAGFAYYQQRQLREQLATAKEIFYAMKALDVDIANIEKLVLETKNQQAIEQVKKQQGRRREMEQNYDKFMKSLHVYDQKMPEQQRLLLRMARVFGECELNIPQGFMEEVQNYIKKWQSSSRLKNAIETAHKNGYTRRITQELLAQNLPPQFFYLALQESNFDQFISGPPTYMGIAKGMWQFIPKTAMKYGLTIGPLAEFRRPDPADDRHNWEKATVAAARYLKDIYSTDAQASGLLVVASYNWGEDKIVRYVHRMPPNPRERNFWRMLTDYRKDLPNETYDYVFYIFSAAVIGENPRLFGFSFDNPLAHLEAQ